jgi:hypothetical protein
MTTLTGHDQEAEDVAPKSGPRLVPPEAYVRTYLTLFGGLLPKGVVAAAQGSDGGALFDTWNHYLSALGIPDYRFDVARAKETNTLMLATFERLGIALCDRAVEADLGHTHTRARADRRLFAFTLPAGPIDRGAFAARFDMLHRTFLGYPAVLAPRSRGERFFRLYDDTVARHAAPGAPPSRFTPPQAGWAAVCYGLIRHPEFHLY